MPKFTKKVPRSNKMNNKMTSKMSSAGGTKASRKARIEEEQNIYPVEIHAEPTAEYHKFEGTISALYGPMGIGKTTFAFNIPGMYILSTEPINTSAKFRHTRIRNWPTFKSFIDKLEDDPSPVKGITMWGIDTIEALVAKCLSSICYEWGLLDLSDEGFSRAWGELKEELIYNLLRLHDLGPGILLISHERQRESKGRRLVITRDTMDLSNSINNAMSFLCSIIMHMRYVDKSKTAAELGDMRCLSVRGSETEDAKDNTTLLEAACTDDTGVIKFKTEQQAVKKILDCFK